jgi:geranylgeranyl diphosphate synthase type I
VSLSEAQIAQRLEAVDAFIERLLPTNPAFQGLYNMLRYHVGWLDRALQRVEGPAGKKLRPTLCLLVADTLGSGWEPAVPAAAAVELVHNFSLVHDDIEDRSPLRRYRETVWTVWGDAQAINVGDAVLILAQRALTEAGAFPAETGLTALRLLNQACLGLCEGQYLDLLWERQVGVTVGEYLEMIERKTARLFECAAELGALCSGASPQEQRQAALFGSSLGLAFQAVDDLLGVWGPETTTGKTADLDLANHKKSLPAVLGLAAPPSVEADRFRALFSLDRPLTSDETAEARQLLETMGIHEQAAAYARRYHDEALRHLDHAAARDRAAVLIEFAELTLAEAYGGSSSASTALQTK